MAYIDGWPIVDGVRTLVGAGAVGGSGLPENILTVSASDGADYTTIAAALAAASSGDVIFICPGTYAESNLTMVAGVNLFGTDPDQCIISKSDAVNAIINSAQSVTISNLTITNQSASKPAIAVTANTLTLRKCTVNATGAGNAITMTAGTLNTFDVMVGVGLVDLSGSICNLNMYQTKFGTAGIHTSGAFAHVISLYQCDLNSQSITSDATGATTLTANTCTRISSATNAGTGTFYIRNCDIYHAIVSNASGDMIVYGGYLEECDDATGSVIWWLDDNTIKVISNMKIADAIFDATSGDDILIGSGYYNESNLTIKDGVNLIGTDRDTCVVYASDAVNPIINSGTATVKNLWIQNTNAGKPAIKVTTGDTLTLRNCRVDGTGAGDAIAMTAGTLNVYNSVIGTGDIDLGTGNCVLNIYNSQITTDPIDTSGNLAHTLKFYHCDFNGKNVASAATGATNLYFYACTNLGAVTEAGSGAIYEWIDDTPVDGEVHAPVSSNWAYDHAASTDSHHAQAHKDSHDPNDGGDPLDTAAPSELASVQAAGVGTSHSLARADHQHQIQHGITDNHLVTVDQADAASGEYVRMTANGIESRSAAESKSDLSFLTNSDVDDTPVNGATTVPPSSNWAYDHNAAVLSGSVHDNDNFCILYGTTTVVDPYPNSPLKIPYMAATADPLAAYDDSDWYGASGAYEQSDADSSANHIEDDSANFPDSILYSYVRWASNAAGTTNVGTGVVFAVASDDLTIFKNTGTDFGASYYYWIQHSEWVVPVTGLYYVNSKVVCLPSEVGKIFVTRVQAYTGTSAPVVVAQMQASCNNALYEMPVANGLAYLTAGDHLFVIGNHTGTHGVPDYWRSDSSHIQLEAFLLKDTT